MVKIWLITGLVGTTPHKIYSKVVEFTPLLGHASKILHLLGTYTLQKSLVNATKYLVTITKLFG